MMKNFMKLSVVAAFSMLLFGAVAQAIEPPAKTVTVDEKLFAGKQVLVLLTGSGISHKEIKNQAHKQDHWILRSPKVVQIGHNSYLTGTALNGPINFKGKVVWIEVSRIQMMREN